MKSGNSFQARSQRMKHPLQRRSSHKPSKAVISATPIRQTVTFGAFFSRHSVTPLSVSAEVADRKQGCQPTGFIFGGAQGHRGGGSD